MKNKRDAEMRLVYACPEFFAKKAKEENDAEYPENRIENDENTVMNDVYGGPDMCDEPEETPYPYNALEGEKPKPMECVYAGPEMMDKPMDIPMMMPVYAVPEYWGKNENGPKPKPDNDDPELSGERKRKPPMMQAVYACPPIKRPPQADDGSSGPNRPQMMRVYAAPPVMGKPIRPVTGAEKPVFRGRFCPICGTKAAETANFCSECGARLPKKPAPDNAPKNTMI